MKEIYIKSFAKINLSIDVKGLLENGYHDVEMVMQQVSLYDLVKIEFEPWEKEEHGIELKTNLVYLPVDQRNLAYQAAILLIKYYAYKIPYGKTKIDIKKKIPVAAGLAGGSGNAAAVLHGLNILWDLGLSLEELLKLGEELGSDVPFTLMGQARANNLYKGRLASSCALASGTGTDLTPLRGLDAYLILVKPSIGVSTKEVYQGIDKCDIKVRPDNEKLIEGLKEKDREKIFSSMANVLEEYTLEAYPVVREIKEMLEVGAKKVLMSGSGPTVFAIYDNKEEALASCNLMREKGYECYWARTTK
ncbi:MAG: 4-(cytidine 5'-diphospho)-2-C-methyl-D-erythritol kinase [Clostridia bacterium]|nr:4-(cytidine 5'-diphospho)-2-C-methyl-D-erythritol kinase [Clostridia bacterium]